MERYQGCIKFESGRFAEARAPVKHGRYGETCLPTLG